MFLTLYPNVAASPRYRVGQFVPYLKSHGIDCAVESALTDEEYQRALDGKMSSAGYHFRETTRRLIQILTAGNYDVVVLQKAVMTAYLKGFDGLLRKKSKVLVLDIDDAVHLNPPVVLGAPWKLFEDRRQVYNLMGSSDLVLAGNRWLMDEVRGAGGKAEYFPTVVDTEHYVPDEDFESSAYRIGWIGNPSTCGQLGIVKDVLEELKGVQTVFVGADKSLMDIQYAKYHTWSKLDELKQIQSFSVGIMPLTKSKWGQGKCALKGLLYMACGVPCVATRFGPIEEIIEHNVNGLFANTDAEWTEALEQLRDPAERKRLGDAGRKTVVAEFSLESLAPRYVEILKGLTS